MSGVKRFRRKPTEIDAIQWTGFNRVGVHQFGARTKMEEGKLYLWVQANKAWLPLEQDEWIAKDFLGYYPIKHEAITRNYEEVQL
jgi:hypothetical protein